MVVDGDEGIGGDVAEDGEGLGLEVGSDRRVAGGVDAFDGGGGLLVGVGVEDCFELFEGEVVGLADLGWGHGGVEEGVQEWFGELGGV